MKREMDIAIVGAGFGGIAMGIALKNAGFPEFRLFEKSAAPGGVWRDNTYPGVACDVPSVLYSYSFEQDYPWSKRYAPGDEIRDYIEHCAGKYGIADRISFECGLKSAAFDEQEARWRLEFDTGETSEADIVISAMGLFNRARLPELPGVDRFKGPGFHSSQWNHDIDLTGKRVAVVGTGASAIQFVPAIAPEVRSLLVFQRSAQYVTPKIASRGADDFDSAAPPEERRKERREIYQEMVNNSDRRYSSEKTRAAQQGFLDYLEKTVPDPELRAKLTPDYPFGCKRVLRSDDWYPALMRDNVELIHAEVTEILPHGLVAAGETYRDIDVIIYNTGFRTTEYLAPVDFTGIGGEKLQASWRGGPEAYLGMTVAGFPNLFIMYGPNTNLAGSIIHMLECQARYITEAIQALDAKKTRSVMVRKERQDAFNADIQKRLSESTMTANNCLNYFQTETGKVVTQWPGSTQDYTVATAQLDENDFIWR